jgi:hypothetical protein
MAGNHGLAAAPAPLQAAQGTARRGTTGHHPYHGNRTRPGVTHIADSGK